MNNTKLNGNIMWFIYDGQCPLCNTAAQVYRIRQAVGELQTVDARTEQHHPVLSDVLARNYDLDQGMVISWQGQYYQGSDALFMMALLGTTSGWFNRINVLLFRTRWLAQLLYPGLRATRNLLLAIKGVAPLRSIHHD